MGSAGLGSVSVLVMAAQCLQTWRWPPLAGWFSLGSGAQCRQARVCQWPEPLGWPDGHWGELDIPRPPGPSRGAPPFLLEAVPWFSLLQRSVLQEPRSSRG